MSYVDYTNKASSMEKWLEEISPKYFDFDTDELHQASQFGYINEVMSAVENDTAHAVSIARREFYPTTANYLKSFYKMGALHELSYPMANPAVATAVLIIKENDIIRYGEPINQNIVTGNADMYQFVIDNTMIIYAGNIPFMLDYPIIITAKLSSKVFSSNKSITNSKYAYTVRYDISEKNSLNDTNIKYIKSRLYKHANETLLMIKVAVRQCSVQTFTESISKSPLLNNISLDFNFTGDMCNFEAFYSEAYEENAEQLVKLPLNSKPKNTKFCMYSMVDNHTLRLSFPNNAYFNPKFNSNITVKIYTTLGEAGNFSQYCGPVVCNMNSEKYPYNNNITIVGKIVGSSVDGYGFPSLDDFKNDVIAAYATNKVFTTDSDLQIMFDSIAMDTRNRIIFSKRRDDVFERLYGAYMLIKDLSGNVVPTNSITGEVVMDDIEDTDSYSTTHTVMIKAGRVWKYHSAQVKPVQQAIVDEDGNPVLDESGNPTYETVLVLRDGRNHSINDENRLFTVYPTSYYVNSLDYHIQLEENENAEIDAELDEMEDTTVPRSSEEFIKHYYTNPFLIRINKQRNAVAYYQNTFNTNIALDMLDVNNESSIQFNLVNFLVSRNAIAGENFYKLSVYLHPSISNSNLSQYLMLEPDDYAKDFSDEGSDFAKNIYAYADGTVERFIYVPGPLTGTVNQTRYPGSIYMIMRYQTDVDSQLLPKTFYDPELEKIIGDDPQLSAVRISSGIEYYMSTTGKKTFKYTPWYSTNLQAGDPFKSGSIIAYAKPLDTGIVRVIGEFVDDEGNVSDIYIPFTLDTYESSNDTYVYSAYLSTNDTITQKDMLTIDYGFFNKYGDTVDTVTINPTGCNIRISTFIKYDDVNDLHSQNTTLGHSYNYEYCRTHTFTNSYQTSSETFDLLKPYNFIRSVMTFQEKANAELVPGSSGYIEGFYIRLHEIPLIRASWMKTAGNVYDIFNVLRNDYDHLYQIYDLLENNFTIDMKFYNTYGKSRYYNIGIKNSDGLVPLNSVNVAFSFGVKLSALTDFQEFKVRFIAYIKSYIEEFNKIENQGRSIFIMDLITQINNNFDEEIECLEYYGVNNFNANNAQVIETWPIEEINKLGYNQYIPEFINLYSEYSNARLEPVVYLTELE